MSYYSVVAVSSLFPFSSLRSNQPVTGLLALYSLALKSSCYDLNTVSFRVTEKPETLLAHLKKVMEQEKEHVACKFALVKVYGIVFLFKNMNFGDFLSDRKFALEQLKSNFAPNIYNLFPIQTLLIRQ